MAGFELLSPGPGAGLLGPAEVAAVARALRRGGLAVLPTETGHLLAAAATVLPAVRKAFAVKRRSLANPMHIACSSLPMAAEYAVLSAPARRLLQAFTPGPLSVVVEQTDRLPGQYVTMNGTVGIRIPAPASTRQVIEALGQPVTATSLNRSGAEGGPVDRDLLESLDWPDGELVYAVVDNAAITHPLPSTLVRVTGAELELLRPGPVDEQQVRAVARGDGPAPATGRASTASVGQ
jgi:L-threonylcarbamoyladenylate synthase